MFKDTVVCVPRGSREVLDRGATVGAKLGSRDQCGIGIGYVCGTQNEETRGKDCLFEESADSNEILTGNQQSVSITMNQNL